MITELKERLYQFQSKNEALLNLGQSLNTIVCLPTGSGKTHVARMIIEELQSVAGSARVLFVAHRLELIIQARKSLESCRVDFALVQSLPTNLTTYDLIVIDECHHSAATTYAPLFKVSAVVLGLSATPIRLDGRSLAPQFSKLIQKAQAHELIAEGWISDIRLFVPEVLIATESTTAAQCKTANTPIHLAAAIDEYRKHANGLQGVTFCTDRQHAADTAEAYRSCGITAVNVDGTMPPAEREEIYDRFHSGEISVICNCELYVEGVDLKGVDFIQVLRPTESLVLYFQMIGRGMRAGAKPLILLDHTSNWDSIGLPTEERIYTLTKGKACATSSTSTVTRTRSASGEVLVDEAEVTALKLSLVEYDYGKRIRQKAYAAELVAKGGLSAHVIGKQVGVNSATIRKWHPKYHLSIKSGQKAHAARLVAKGELSTKNIAKEVGVSKTTIRSWHPDSLNNSAKKDKKDKSREERKAHVAMLVLEGGLSIEFISKEARVSGQTIRLWHPGYRLKTDNSCQKVHAARLVAKGFLGLKGIAKEVGVTPGTIRLWHPEYRPVSDKSGQKDHAARLVAKGELFPRIIAKEVGVSQSTIRSWHPGYKRRGTPS